MRITAAHAGYEHECSRKNVTDNVKPAVEHYRDVNIIGVVKVEADVVYYHTEYAEASYFIHKACTSVFLTSVPLTVAVFSILSFLIFFSRIKLLYH